VVYIYIYESNFKYFITFDMLSYFIFKRNIKKQKEKSKK
jgi:hypothetical protein